MLNIDLGEQSLQSSNDIIVYPPFFYNEIHTKIQNNSVAGSISLDYWIPTMRRFSFGIGPFLGFNNNVAKTVVSPQDDSQAPGSLNAIPSTQIKTNVHFNTIHGGVDFMPAITLLKSTLFFASIGVDFQQAKITTNTLYIGVSNSYFSNSTLLTGLRLGFGLIKQINHSFALNMAYTHTNYGKNLYSGEPKQSFSFPKQGTSSNTYLMGGTYLFGAQKTNYFSDIDGTLRYNGPFVMVSGGLLSNQYHNQNTNLYRIRLGIPNGGNNLSDTNFGTLHGQGGVHVGYGQFLNRFYLGVDLGAEFADRTESASTYQDQTVAEGGLKDSSTNISTNIGTATYAVKFKPGFIFAKDFLMYLQIGPVLSRANTILTQNYIFPTGLNFSLQQTVNTKKNLIGWCSGFGIQQLLSDHYALSLEYLYNDYGNIKNNQTSLSPNQLRTFVSKENIALRSQSVMLGIVRYFS